MKKLLLLLMSLTMLCSCVGNLEPVVSDSFSLNADSVGIEVGEGGGSVKPTVTITVKVNFGRIRKPDSSGWTYLSQAWCSINPEISGLKNLSFTLKNVDCWNGTNSMKVYIWNGLEYSDYFEALSTDYTFVDRSSLTVSPASLNELYNFEWNFENLNCYVDDSGVSVPPVPDPEQNPRGNRISLQKEGNTWFLISQYPVASELNVYCGGPTCPAMGYPFPKGTNKINTQVSVDVFEIDFIDPISDDVYDYYYNQATGGVL
ncbi:MAG: hypothetical protein J6K31_01235 [Parabacteroides sp.]|nr:hypothetical protein [Parabacteroides sp.]